MYRSLKTNSNCTAEKLVQEEEHCFANETEEEEGKNLDTSDSGSTQKNNSEPSGYDCEAYASAIKRQQAISLIRQILQKMGNDDKTPEMTRKTSNELNRLNKKQREILMRTFKPMEADSVKYGLRMLVALFAEHPRYKKIWPQFRAIPDSSLMSAIELRRHASVYMAGLGQIIHSMDNETVLAEQLNRIARAHIKWNIQRYHIEVYTLMTRPEHMLAPVLDEVRIANRGLDTESREAWVTLYDVIANLVEIYRAVNITNTSQNGTRNPNIQRQNTTY